MEHIGAPGTSLPNVEKSKCEFCEITFNSDLDVSRHLSSDTHSAKLNEYMALQNRQEKMTRQKVPKKIKDVFDSLKIRDVRGLRELTAKGYFQMTDDSQVDIAESMAVSLFESLIDYESRKLPDDLREQFISMINEQPPDPVKEADTMPEPTGTRYEASNSVNDPTSAQHSASSSFDEQQDQPRSETNRQPSTGSRVTVIKSAHDPQPRLDSTYIPKLAVIKIEPKD